MTNRWTHTAPNRSAVTEPAAPTTETAAPLPAPRPRTAAPRAANEPADRADRTTPAADARAAVTPASSPDLQQRLKRVLRSGANMEVAADGFKSAEQFAVVAHASRNTDVPFMLLKHRVVEEGKSVDAAIHESKPDLDAAAEVAKARTQARDDVAALSGAGN